MKTLFLNKKKNRKLIAPLLAAVLAAGAFACCSAAEETDSVRFGVLSGPTGIGAARLLTDSDNDETTNAYDYVIASDNSEIVSGLTTGELDIACMASNTALNLYNQGVEIQVIALGTQGVLHILESGQGEEIQSISDLEGRTIYATGQGSNPEYILRYLLESNDLDPDTDVEIVFADATEISAGLISGEIETAMLPVPAATAAILQSDGTVRDAIDVNDVWEDLGNGSSLIMTAVVARTEFIEENPDAVETFLEEYEASIGYINSNVEEAAELVAGLGITPSAAIAAAAIPQCNLIFISGEAMEPAISDYYDVLYEADPDSVGGALPDDGFYYCE
ncbi:MAG: ABC transporter substrate-binding protein [Lachnospiraceae bacterium]|nr:ABC transporter substrate-binding protein [Lachnospiraceae bacterium]